MAGSRRSVRLASDGYHDRPIGRTIKTSERVAKSIIEQILGNNLVAGDALPSEAALIVEQNVGRSSLREALRILEIHGLITIRPGNRGGTTVGSVDPRSYGRMSALYFQMMRATYMELMEARLVVEPVMAGLAAQRRDDTQLDNLRAVVDETTRLGADQTDEQLRLAGRFHEIVAGASGNRILDLIGQSLKSLDDGVKYLAPHPVDARADAIRAHQKIADAILAGDVSRSEKLMRGHMEKFITSIRSRRIQALDDIVDWS